MQEEDYRSKWPCILVLYEAGYENWRIGGESIDLSFDFLDNEYDLHIGLTLYLSFEPQTRI